MQTRSKSKSIVALTTSTSHPYDLVYSEPCDIYSAMQSPHWANAVKQELHALAINNCVVFNFFTSWDISCRL